MRAFVDIERELNLARWQVRPHGSLYLPGPIGSGRPYTHVVRYFDGDLPATLAPAYASFLAAAQEWIERDPALAAVVRVEQPMEVGDDFVARHFYQGNSLWSYFDDEDPPEPPDALVPMQTRFRARGANTLQDELVKAVLARSILEPNRTSTMYLPREEKFVVVDIEPTRDELERWARLMRS